MNQAVYGTRDRGFLFCIINQSDKKILCVMNSRIGCPVNLQRIASFRIFQSMISRQVRAQVSVAMESIAYQICRQIYNDSTQTEQEKAGEEGVDRSLFHYLHCFFRNLRQRRKTSS